MPTINTHTHQAQKREKTQERQTKNMKQTRKLLVCTGTGKNKKQTARCFPQRVRSNPRTCTLQVHTHHPFHTPSLLNTTPVMCTTAIQKDEYSRGQCIESGAHSFAQDPAVVLAECVPGVTYVYKDMVSWHCRGVSLRVLTSLT